MPRPSSYADKRADMAERSRASSREGREIGPLPKVADPDRRELCKDDLELFGLTYFPRRFRLKLATFHHEAIKALQHATHEGGLTVVALPRGSGKDTWAEVEVLRAILYGHRRFVVFIGATEPAAKRSLKKIKKELETNKLLLADFPEVCYPIARLDGINHRARGQTLDGEHTSMEWTDDSVVLPTVDGSVASGSVIYVAGITGAIRGPSVLGPDGEPVRPDMVILNDCQTRESAKSPTQTSDREAVVSDDVIMLAGPDTSIAATMLCTVIYRNDLSDRFLDAERHPEWDRVRTRMLESFPRNMDLWDEYAERRRSGMREGDRGKAANEFYAANREKMDDGGRVSWPDRKKKDELSGLQSAMNHYIDNPRGFHAELQNDPQQAELAAGSKELTVEGVSSRLAGSERYAVPEECTRVTAFIDCGAGLLWYAVVAWNENFGGAVIDYGAWPRQNRQVFEATDARPSLRDVYPQCGSDAQRVFAGLGDLTSEILGRTYYKQGGGEIRVERCLIDAGWEGQSVYQFVRQSPYANMIYPSRGFARTTTARGISEWRPRPGERKGHFWRLTMGEADRIRTVQFDPDAWKSIIHAALTIPLGGRTGLSLYGRRVSTHEMIAAHCCAEYSTPVTLRGQTFDKWELRPDRPDNHLWDALVGAAVAASVAGLAWSATGTPVQVPEVKPLRYADVKGGRVPAQPVPATPGAAPPLRYADVRGKRR